MNQTMSTRQPLRMTPTVIMRTKNSAWVIRESLKGLFSQDLQDFQLLVVDSGSTDGTLDIVREFPARIIEIEPDDYFPGDVLNRAVAETDSDLVVFQNSDTIPQRCDALRLLLEPLSDEDVQATFGRQIARPEAWTWVKRDLNASFPESGPAPDWISLALPFAAMRRSAWERHPFYRDAWGSEDTEWGEWARKNGLRIEYVPDAVVMHSHNYTLRQFYGRRFIEGEADAFIFRNHDTLPKLLSRIASSIGHDLVHYARHADLLGIPMIPVRRFTSHWAYWKGHRHGEERIASSNRDRLFGQQTVLQRHDSADRAEAAKISD